MEAKYSDDETISDPIDGLWYLHTIDKYISKRNGDQLILWSGDFEFEKDIELKLKNNLTIFQMGDGMKVKESKNIK